MASTGVRWASILLAAAAVAALTLQVIQITRPPLTTSVALGSLDRTDLEEPDSVALALHAAARLEDERMVTRYAGKLWALRIERGGDVGWGLNYVYDAFQDGSTNPADTIYSYTTAQAGLAYLDAYDVTGNRRYLDAAESAADTILDRTCCDQAGAIWYTDQDPDQVPEHVVANVNGLAAALLLRLPPEGRYSAAGRRLVDGLLATRKGNDWLYRAGDDKISDLVHLSFVIRGLAADPRTRPVAMEVADAALRDHFTTDLEPHQDYATMGSSQWGPPAFLVALQDLDHPQAAELERALAGSVDLGDLDEYPRTRAWYAYALAS